MKPLLIFAAFAGALLLLAAIAIGLMVSISSGSQSWLLTGVFAFDTLVLVALAARAMLGGQGLAAGGAAGREGGCGVGRGTERD